MTIPAFTVCICTYRRPEALRRLLESVAAQAEQPADIIVVDGSPDSETARMIEGLGARGGATPVRYFQAAEADRGLTRQRNIALAQVETPLAAFFDDDVVLLPGALGALARVHREHHPAPAGVAAMIENELEAPPAKWRLRRLLRAVPDLEPGRYTRSGMSIPWSFLGLDAPVTHGDWLPGGATMWRTDAARSTGFDPALTGYGNGEDLEFSRRVAAHGPLLMCPAARVLHLHAPAGRPDARKLGYMTVLNTWRIHRGMQGRSAADVARFGYAHVLELLFLSAGAVRDRAPERRSYLRGYAAGLRDLVSGRGR